MSETVFHKIDFTASTLKETTRQRGSYRGFVLSENIFDQTKCATPNKVITMCDSGALKLSQCGILVLDECDKMLEVLDKKNVDDLKTFAAQVKVIKNQCKNNLQMGLFSATMCGAVEKFGAANFPKNGVTVTIGRDGNSVAETVSQKVLYCGDER